MIVRTHIDPQTKDVVTRVFASRNGHRPGLIGQRRDPNQPPPEDLATWLTSVYEAFKSGTLKQVPLI